VIPLRLLVVGILLAILFSLGSALWQLSAGRGDSRRMLRSLSWRAGLSIALLALLVVAASRGWITPHGVGR
jgi:hypothetical protein